ncbi:MAG: hypothetical protein IT307_15020 [Chloroflexi bacterium]|nr:hypothetical protein [Chloroflexota bacterium]
MMVGGPPRQIHPLPDIKPGPIPSWTARRSISDASSPVDVQITRVSDSVDLTCIPSAEENGGALSKLQVQVFA